MGAFGPGFIAVPPVSHRIIVDKIDVNKDGYVTEKELEEWVRHVANRYVQSTECMQMAALSCVSTGTSWMMSCVNGSITMLTKTTT